MSKNRKDRIVRQPAIFGGKFLKPRVFDNFVQRQIVTTLSTKIIQGIKAALVVAPAGYGKSILLAQTSDALTNKDYHCYWLSIDNKDNDPLRFLSHLITLICTPDVLERHFTTSHFVSERKATIDYIIADIADILERKTSKHTIFIDDYHAINNPEVHSILNRLILYSSEQTVFVIATRNEPDLTLNAVKVRSEVFQLSRKDLTFDLDETERFLNASKQLGLNHKFVSALAHRTEGWVAGLQLASLAMIGNDDYETFVNEFTGTDRDVTDYLGEVILAQQSDEIRRFLLLSSVLERMCSDLVNYALNIELGQMMLEQVEDRNLFIIPLDRTRTWYRYHHLFGDFLRNVLNKEYPNIAEKICRRACTWCVEHGLIHEAINYAISGGNYDLALELIGQISEDLILESGENWTLMNWIQKLPGGFVLNKPRISLAYIWSLVFSRQYCVAREQINMLKRYCEQYKDKTKPEKVIQINSGIKLLLCLMETASDNSIYARELLKEWIHENPSATNQELLITHVLQTYNSLFTLELNLAEASAKKAIAYGEQCSIGYLVSWTYTVSGLVDKIRGNLNNAAEQYIKGLNSNNKGANEFSYMGSLNTVLLAEVYFEQNELDKAEELLQNRFEYIDSEAVVEVAFAGYRVMASLHFLKAGLDEALEIVHLGQESADRVKLPRLKALLSALEIHFLLKSGRGKDAQIVAKNCGFDESRAPAFDQDSRQVFQEIRELVRVELNLHNHLPKKAMSILNTQILLCKEIGRYRRLMKLLLSRAKAFYALKRTDDAVADLSLALEIASKGGFYRLFLDAGDEIHQVLRLIVKDYSSKQTESVIVFLGKINELLFKENNKKQSETAHDMLVKTLLEPMTKRERQMLDFIKTGETNKSIADQLFISEQTVKWHIHQLYKKLGVKNRTSAIVKASSLSLI